MGLFIGVLVFVVVIAVLFLSLGTYLVLRRRGGSAAVNVNVGAAPQAGPAPVFDDRPRVPQWEKNMAMHMLDEALFEEQREAARARMQKAVAEKKTA